MKGIAKLKIIKKNKSFYVIKKDQKNKNLLILLYECHCPVAPPGAGFKNSAIYAKVFLQTVEDEYSKASKVYHQKFSIPKVTPERNDDPDQNLTSVIMAIRKKMNTTNLKHRHTLNLIARLLKRIQDDLAALSAI